MDSAYSPHSITYRRTSSFGFQTRLHSRGNAPSSFLSASSTIAHKQTYLFIYIQYVDCHPPGKVLSLHTSAGKRSCTDHHHLVRDLEKAVQYTDPVIFLVYSQMSSFLTATPSHLTLNFSRKQGAPDVYTSTTVLWSA